MIPAEAEVVAKFVVTQVTTTEYKHNYKQTDIELQAYGEKTLPEDKRFHEATPSGTLKMVVTNNAAIEKLKAGKVFYLAFIPAPELSPNHD